MRFLRFLGRHPVAVFSAVAVAFLAWVWSDALVGPQPLAEKPLRVNDLQATAPEVPFPPRRVMPLPPGQTEQPDQARVTPPPKVETLQRLKPGMTRTQVEELVGVPAAQGIYPVTIADGKATYHTTYEADLGAPSTVRPIDGKRPFLRPLPDPTRATVTLEFDATQPGHPLLGVYFPDPLF